MSDASTRQLVATYIEKSAGVSGFYTSHSRYRGFNSEKVEIDVQRSGEDVAIVIQDISTGRRLNESSLFTNKEFLPPIYNEEFVLNSYELLKRTIGNNPFENPDFGAAAAVQAFNGFRKIEDKIRRAIELQWSQIFQTGKMNLLDASGAALYAMLFQAKTSHFPGAAIDWDETNYDPLLDLENLLNVVWVDGKKVPVKVVFGTSAFRAFMSNTAVKERFRKDALPLGMIQRPDRRGGAVYHGEISIGQYVVQIWTYPEFYKHPQTGVSTPYQSPWLVTVLPDDAEYVTAFGAIPQLVRPDPRVASFLPGRISNEGGQMDLSTFAWVSPDGTTLHLSAGTRPMTIPVAIDTFGTLNAKVT